MNGSDLRRLTEAWNDMFVTHAASATHALTLTYNNFYGATASWCYRILDGGECLRLPTSGVPVERDVNRLPTLKRITLEQVHADLRAWHYRVDRILYGSRFHRLPEHRRSAYIGMVEHIETNVHVHLIWTMPMTQAVSLADAAAKQWQTITGGYGSVAVSQLHDGEGWAAYCTKDHVGRALEEHPLLFVSSLPTQS